MSLIAAQFDLIDRKRHFHIGLPLSAIAKHQFPALLGWSDDNSSTMDSMSMSMPASSRMVMPSMTMSGMASSTASSMGGMSHGDHGSSGSMMMDMSDMMMVFFTATNTPLYSASWTPGSTGAYAGTCIFLILLSAIFRGILAVRCNFSAIWAQWSAKRHGSLLEYERGEDFAKQGRRPWRVNEAATRALVDTALAGVSYLLQVFHRSLPQWPNADVLYRMLAVMTMNVGYFMSVLGGIFFGSFIIGDRIGAVAH